MRKIIASAAFVIVGALSIGVMPARAAVTYHYDGAVLHATSSINSVWMIATTTIETQAYDEPTFVAQYGAGIPILGSAISPNAINEAIPNTGTYYVMIKDTTGFAYYDVPENAYFFVLDDGVLTAASGETRIIQMEPDNGTTTQNPVTFNFKAYIAPQDVGNILNVRIELHNVDQNVIGAASFFSPSDLSLYFGTITEAGVFSFSTTTILGEGNYRFNALLDSCATVLGVCTFIQPIGGVHIEANTQFIVGTSTFIGQITQDSFAQMNNIFASTTATTTSALARSCVPLGGFDPMQCLAFLFVPDSVYLSRSLDTLYQNVLTRFPMGYVTDLIAILSTTTESSLPLIDATIPDGVAGSGSSIHVELAHSLDYILNATTSAFANESASSTETFFEITNGYWKIVVYLLAVLYMLRRILGAGMIPSFGKNK